MGAGVMDILANYNPSRSAAQTGLLENQLAQQRAITPTVGPMAQQQLQAETLKNQIAQQQLKDAQIFRDAYSNTPDGDPAKVRDYMLKNGISGPGFMTWQKHDLDLRTSAAKLTADQLDNELKQHGEAADIIQGIKAAPPEQQNAMYQSQLPQLKRLAGAGAPLPDQYDPSTADALMGVLGHGSKILADQKTVAEAKSAESTAALNAAKQPGEEAKSKLEAAKASAVQTMTPDKLAAQVGASIDPKVEPGEYRRTLALASSALSSGLGMEGVQAAIKDGADRVGRRESAIAQARATAPIKIYTAAETEKAKNAAYSMAPETVDMAAEYFRKTGAMPQGISRNRLAVKQIMDRAAAMGPVDLAGDKVAFAANQASLTGLVKNRDAVAAFENTAGKNLDLFLKTAQPVIDSGSPWLNTPIRAISDKALGSTELPAFQAARQVAINEIAKVTGNPGLSGQLSDTARKEVESFIPANATLGQIYSVAKILKQDMANRRQSYDEQIGEIQKRVGGTPGTVNSPAPSATTPAAPQEKYSPSTGKHYISADGGKTWQVKP